MTVIVTCDECGQEMYANDDDKNEVYCADHYGQYDTLARGDHDRVAQAHREQEHRRHVIDNDRNVAEFGGRR